MTDTSLALTSFVVIGVSIALWAVAIRRVTVPANRGIYIAAWTIGGVLGALALLGSPGWIAGTLALLGLIAAAFLLITVAIGGQKVGPDAIRAGMTIPAFTAADDQGKPFESSSLAGNPALIKFFRGHW